MRPATGCCAISPSRSRRSCASPISPRATAATSSSCSCPTRRRKAPWKSRSAFATASPAHRSSSTARASRRASASASPATRKTAPRSTRSPPMPTARSTPPNRTAATAASSSAPPSRRKRQLPVLPDDWHAELAVRLAFHLTEAELGVDGARRDEVGVRPEYELAIAGLASEPDAHLNQALAEPGAARLGLDEEQPQLGGARALPDDKRRADALAVAFGDPAVLVLGIEVTQELGDDVGHQGLEQGAPAVLLAVEHAVALHHPAHVARAVRTQCGRVRRRARYEHRLDGLHRRDQPRALAARERRQHLAHRAARGLIQRGEGLAALRRERQPDMARIVPRRLALH